ncbi:MAG: ABC transporter ATP-binding protein [Vicinamibacterales bacterium]|nr:ABC transporter ATP-binding protein [Vicinamibacterales bacterium]
MSSSWVRLLERLRPYRRAFTGGLAWVMATTIITLASPWVLKLAIDDLTAGVTPEKIRAYAAAVFAIAVAGGVGRFEMRRLIVGASRGFEYDLRNAFFAHLQRLAPADLQRLPTGDLMSRATNDLNAVRMMMGPAIMYSASTGLTFVVALGAMVAIAPRLTLIALLPLPFVTLSVRYFGAAIHRRFERIQAQLSVISTIVQEALAGVRVVRAYGQEAHEVARFREANDEYVRRNRRLIALQGIYYPSMGFLMGLASLLVLWLGAREVVAGRLTVGALVAFNGYLMLLTWPMIAFGWVTNLLQRGLASWERLLAVLDVVPSVADAGLRHHIGPEAIRGTIEFRGLTFDYGDGRPVLREVSAIIAAGTTTAIVGPTGAGKSTLLHLLARLHDPPPGMVFLDGMDVCALPLATVRGALGVVPQEPFLFSTTIADNIAFGAADPGAPATREAVRAAAAVARLEADVDQFPLGYDTLIGERGITLSGGQKQRTAIARAVCADPRVLVLDDALSAVDTDTEERILEGLRAVRRTRTTVIVAHRVSTVRDADQILVLDEGRLVEQGTHDTLVARGGRYAELARQQQLEAELAAS